MDKILNRRGILAAAGAAGVTAVGSAFAEAQDHKMPAKGEIKEFLDGLQKLMEQHNDIASLTYHAGSKPVVVVNGKEGNQTVQKLCPGL